MVVCWKVCARHDDSKRALLGEMGRSSVRAFVSAAPLMQLFVVSLLSCGP